MLYILNFEFEKNVFRLSTFDSEKIFSSMMRILRLFLTFCLIKKTKQRNMCFYCKAARLKNAKNLHYSSNIFFVAKN